MENEKAGDKNPIRETLSDLSNEYSYLDFLIEKKFYKKFRSIFYITITVISIIFAILTFLGITTINDLFEYRNQAEEANNKIKEVYQEYQKQDSLNTFREENSQYFAYHTAHDYRKRLTIINRFREYGFNFNNVIVEDKLIKFMEDNEATERDSAYQYILNKKIETEYAHYIGVTYNSIPEKIKKRVDGIFRDVYNDVEIKYFLDKRLPEKGIIYYIE